MIDLMDEEDSSKRPKTDEEDNASVIEDELSSADTNGLKMEDAEIIIE